MKKILPLFFVVVCLGCLSDENENKEIGCLSKDLLSGGYENILIEIDYQKSAKLNISSITFFRDKVSEICQKNVIISIDDEISDGDIKGEYESADKLCKPISEKYRDFISNDTTIGLYIIVIEEKYISNENVMGIAYRYDSFVIFDYILDVINNIGGDFYEISAQRHILLHEFGHILGLSNWDSDGNMHCNNSNCVMHKYFQVYRNYSYFIDDEPDFCDECYLEIDEKRG